MGKTKTITYAGWAILALLLAFRFVSLNIDPPFFYSGHSQAQVTDPYHLSFSARNAVLHDDWNPHDFHRWDVFKYSLVSGVSYLLFSKFGVSRVTANLAGILLHLGGFALFLWGLYGFRPRGEVLLTALLLLLNSSLYFFGRLPFLENGLIFLCGLTFFLFMRYHDQKWGQFLIGFVVAIAALNGKLFGLLLGVPIVLTMLYVYRTRTLMPLLIIAAGGIVGVASQTFLFYDGNISVMYNYYAEQSVGMYGPPPGLTSPVNFFKMLLSYGAESGLWRYTPFLLIMMIFSLVFAGLTFPIKEEHRKEFISLCFSVTWLIGVAVFLSPFHHRPVRYSLFFFMPASALCAYMIWRAVSPRIVLRLNHKYISIGFIFLLFWYCLVQIAVLLGPDKNLFESAQSSMILMAFIAAGLTFFMAMWLYRIPRVMPRVPFLVLTLFLCLGHVVTQGSYFYRGLSKPINGLEQSNYELSIIIDKNSTLTGPYMPALTIDNELDGVIYMFGLSDVEKDLFQRFPITHVVTDSPNWKEALKSYPQLKNASKIAQLIARDRAIELYRLADAHVEPTDFERGSMFLVSGKLDSALIALQRFNKKYPESMLGKMHLVVALLANNRLEEAVTYMDILTTKHASSFVVHRFCQVQYERLYRQTRKLIYHTKAQYHSDEALRLNPVIPKAAK